MFVRYFLELPIDRPRVEEALTRDPQEWIPRIAEDATSQGDALLAEVGFGNEVRVKRRVALEFGTPVHLSHKTMFPLQWTPTEAAGLFPALDADLEIVWLAPERTQLAISARYAPPLGSIGRAIDRTLLFRVAEATMKDFLDGVGEAVMASFTTA